MHSLCCLTATDYMHIVPTAPISEQTDEFHLAGKANLTGIERQWIPRIIHIERPVLPNSRF